MPNPLPILPIKLSGYIYTATYLGSALLKSLILLFADWAGGLQLSCVTTDQLGEIYLT